MQTGNKRAWLLCVGLSLLFGRVAWPATEKFGLGVIVGEPTGLSAKWWLSDDRAVDAAAAWSFSGHDSLQLHADYLFHNYTLLKLKDGQGRLPVYYGIGGRIKFKDSDKEDDNPGKGDGEDVGLGIRFPVGLTYLPPKAPLDFFLEIVPIFEVAPDSDLDLGAAIGARFYFK